MTGWKPPTDEEMAILKDQWEREDREPTPLPWRVAYADQSGGHYYDGTQQLVEILGANDYTVADNEPYYPHAIKAADAEVIVRAVNAHDALVAVLEKAEYWYHSETPDDVRDEVAAALALALAASHGLTGAMQGARPQRRSPRLTAL